MYAKVYFASATGATVCLPVSTIGREYYSVNFHQVAQPRETNSNAYSYFFVMGTEDNTQVQVIPAAGSLSGSMAAGQPFTIILNRGQVFNYLSRTDLTGSIIPQKLKYADNTVVPSEGKLVPHLFATAGYRFLLSEDLNLLTSVMVKYINPLPVQADINLKLEYWDLLWGGSVTGRERA